MYGIVNEVWVNPWIAQHAKKKFHSVTCNGPK